MDKKVFETMFREKMEALRGIDIDEATPTDCYGVIAAIVREQIMRNWAKTNNAYRKGHVKQTYYFSLEFLLGKMLESNLNSLGLTQVCREVLTDLKFNPDEVFDIELDPGLGNGGLGRLAACFMDSLAALSLPGHGCSIRYKYGLFEQKIVDGYQVEMPDNWLRNENPWEIKKPNKAITVKFFGDVKEEYREGRPYYHLENYEPVIAMPYDVPMVGYDNQIVNNLRLWSAESVRQFNFESFCSGDYLNAVADKYSAEAISEVLYPDDSTYQNRQLRLKQQYFFVSAGVQSIIRHYVRYYGDIRKLPDYICIHINDTHPALAVPELMRILLDEYFLEWDEAWDITVRTISYTNHTVLPEALEKWPVEIYAQLLPRIYGITHEINERFCREVFERFDGDLERVGRMAIESHGEIRMAYLAIAGSHAVNGVAAVHSKILITDLFREFYEMYPERFSNKTNGVAHRRWLIQSNPDLSERITEAIGPQWIREPTWLSLLDEKGFTTDPAFLQDIKKIKLLDKERLAKYIWDNNGVRINPHSIFDVQIKRIHAYKRQLMLVMQIMDMYHRILDNPNDDIEPRTFIFAGKAAPSYHLAKEIIKLISTISDRINNDPRVGDRLKVVFLENYRVSLAQLIFPAAQVSEQISTAGKEASGTGNMKFMMNGAITIGTLDGANIEILDAVGHENFIQFGLTVDEVLELKRSGDYSSRRMYEEDHRIKRIFDELINTKPWEIGGAEFPRVYESLITSNDEFLVLKDFDAYVNAQNTLDRLYKDEKRWLQMSAKNIAFSGPFASDEVIKKYAEEIWEIEPVELV